MGILVSIFKHKTSWDATHGRFKLKFLKMEVGCGKEGGLEERLVAGIVLPLMATTRPNMVFAKSSGN